MPINSMAGGALSASVVTRAPPLEGFEQPLFSMDGAVIASWHRPSADLVEQKDIGFQTYKNQWLVDSFFLGAIRGPTLSWIASPRALTLSCSHFPIAGAPLLPLREKVAGEARRMRGVARSATALRSSIRHCIADPRHRQFRRPNSSAAAFSAC